MRVPLHEPCRRFRRPSPWPIASRGCRARLHAEKTMQRARERPPPEFPPKTALALARPADQGRIEGRRAAPVAQRPWGLPTGEDVRQDARPPSRAGRGGSTPRQMHEPSPRRTPLPGRGADLALKQLPDAWGRYALLRSLWNQMHGQIKPHRRSRQPFARTTDIHFISNIPAAELGTADRSCYLRHRAARRTKYQSRK